MKICKSTLVIIGCGWPKDEDDFQKTGKGGHMSVCKKCVQRHKDGIVPVKRKYEPSAETKLFNQFDKLSRGKRCAC